MPTEVTVEVVAYAHCPNPRCAGYQQEEVAARQTEESWSYAEQGGDLPGQERSFVRLFFINDGREGRPDELHCKCGLVRELSATPRRQYRVEGFSHDPMALLDIDPFDPKKQASQDEELVKENSDLRDRLSQLEGMMSVFLAQQVPSEQQPQEAPPEQPPAEG